MTIISDQNEKNGSHGEIETLVLLDAAWASDLL